MRALGFVLLVLGAVVLVNLLATGVDSLLDSIRP